MSDVLEKRLSDPETLTWELPTLLTTRMSGVEAALAAVSSRLDHLDRSMSMLHNDMRDLRGGVTRQLVGQDQRIKALEERITSLETEVKGRMSAVEAELSGLRSATTSNNQKLDLILSRLPQT